MARADCRPTPGLARAATRTRTLPPASTDDGRRYTRYPPNAPTNPPISRLRPDIEYSRAAMSPVYGPIQSRSNNQSLPIGGQRRYRASPIMNRTRQPTRSMPPSTITRGERATMTLWNRVQARWPRSPQPCPGQLAERTPGGGAGDHAYASPWCASPGGGQAQRAAPTPVRGVSSEAGRAPRRAAFRSACQSPGDPGRPPPPGSRPASRGPPWRSKRPRRTRDDG